MDPIIDPEFAAALCDDPEDQRVANLTKQIIDDKKILHPIVVWPQEDGPPIIVDGMTRWTIWKTLPKDYGIARPEITEKDFEDRDAALEWIEDHALNQRNLSRERRDTILARKAERRRNRLESLDSEVDGQTVQQPTGTPVPDAGGRPKAANAAAAEVAEESGVSTRTVVRATAWDKAVKRIEKFNERLGGRIRTGKLKVAKEDVIEIGKLNEQKFRRACANIESGQPWKMGVIKEDDIGGADDDIAPAKNVSQTNVPPNKGNKGQKAVILTRAQRFKVAEQAFGAAIREFDKLAELGRRHHAVVIDIGSALFSVLLEWKKESVDLSEAKGKLEKILKEM